MLFVHSVRVAGIGVLESHVDVRAPTAEKALELVKRKLEQEKNDDLCNSPYSEEVGKEDVTYHAVANSDWNFQPINPREFSAEEVVESWDADDPEEKADEYFLPKTE